MTTWEIVFLVLFIIAIMAGTALAYFAYNKGKALVEKKFADAGKTAEGIIDDAKKSGFVRARIESAARGHSR